MFVYLLLFISCVGATIVPEEIPSLLSIVYSNIPPIKKGTDSRVGFGFALGPHADFQVLFELGPQKDTQQSPMAYPRPQKRVAPRKTHKSQTKRKVNTNKPDSNADGGEFINSWSEQFKKTKTPKPFEPLPIPDNIKDSATAGTIDLKKIIETMGMTNSGELNQPKPNIPSNTLNRLKELYGQIVAEENINTLSTTTTDRPRFVLKKNKTKAQVSTELPSSFDRLTQFAVNEERNNAIKKRRVTEDLSDVSLDDE